MLLEITLILSVIPFKVQCMNPISIVITTFCNYNKMNVKRWLLGFVATPLRWTVKGSEISLESLKPVGNQMSTLGWKALSSTRPYSEKSRQAHQ